MREYIVITPIAMTTCDWNKLFDTVSKILCRPLSASLDSKNLTGRGLPEFISTLGEFHIQNTDPVAAQRAAGFLLKHASVSFFAIMPPESVRHLLIAGNISILDCEYPNMMILSATLAQWRETIINLCSQNQTNEMRAVGTKLIQAFDAMGLSRLFEAFSRRASPQDGLLQLVQK
jgi:hypothetical protein